MNLTHVQEGTEHIVKAIVTDDEEMDAFRFFFGLLCRRTYYSCKACKGRLCGIHQGWSL